VTSQIDGNKHTTKYVRNALEQVTEIVDPKSRKTTKEYDGAGNLTKLTDALKRTTTYAYDPANRLKEVSYSDGKTHAVEYEYNKDGKVTVMKDGSGTTKYTYDQLDRLTEVENGHKEVIKYEYNLGNELTKITYPNGKAVTREYDKDGRLEKVTDWLSHTTKFSYDPDSDLAATAFPSETKDEDKYAYNEADQMRVTGKCTYGAYGTPTCEGASTTPLGFDGQYTSSDTGLIYLRNRVYDPATAQFLTVDPAVGITRAPYNYAGDNPVNHRDRDGLSAEGLEGVPCYFPFCGPPPPPAVEEGIQHGLEKLSKRETERILDEAGTDAHTDKEQTVGEGEAGHYDYYRDKSTGEIYLVPKSGGEPIPTGLGG
jgi:RHS repeat-associated protein